MSVAIRPAATLILLRDTEHGPQVLLLRRARGAAFLGGAYVFPGGAVDAADGDAATLALVHGLTADAADAHLGTPGALRYWITAVRECFEECGVLLACRADESPVGDARWLHAARVALQRGELAFGAWLARERLRVPAHDVVYCDHWITPAGRPRRFDTRFFLARAPSWQAASPDAAEIVDAAWLRPEDALARVREGAMEAAYATRQVLHELARFASVDATLDGARARGPIAVRRPVVAQGAQGPRVFGEGDAAYAEIRWSDPGETTQTTYDLVPGAPKRLDAWVTRIIAPNGSVMTGPGTNTYLVGEASLVVIDPGPSIDAHLEAVLAAAAGRIRWIACTHTHRDHSPAALRLAQATGAPLIGLPPPPHPGQDATFRPDRLPRADERLVLGDVVLHVVHTPGHASNHCCYRLEATGMLFTGDHVMQGSTVIIDPPDGDMRAYLASLERLLALEMAIIAPGHGYLIGAPHDEVRRLMAHRLAREARVVDALRALGPAPLDTLLPRVYADVPVQKHRAASRSLLAHLAKLAAEDRVREEGGRYALR